MDLGKHASWNEQGEWSWPQPTRLVEEIPPVCPYCTLNGTTGETGCTCGYLRQLELQKAQQEGRTADYQDGKVMYHLAPSRRRQKILEEGLRPDADQTMPTGHTPGVYLWDSPETAHRYKSQGLGDSDLWAVRTNDMLPINKDWHVDNLADLDGMADMPEVAEARMQKFPGAHYVTYPIPPENLRLHTPDPWKDPWMMSDQAQKLFNIQDQRDTTAKTAADKACERCGNPVRDSPTTTPAAFQEQYCDACRAEVAKEKNLPWMQEPGVKPEWLYGNDTTAKTAAGQVMYHVAPPHLHQQIMDQGLTAGEPSDDYPKGVYLWHDPYDAGEYYHTNTKPLKMYEINTQGLNLEDDPMLSGRASYTNDPVGPERIGNVYERVQDFGPQHDGDWHESSVHTAAPQYAYHRPQPNTPEVHQSILANGIVPSGRYGNHVYLFFGQGGTDVHGGSTGDEYRGAPIRVDMSKIDPANLSADPEQPEERGMQYVARHEGVIPPEALEMNPDYDPNYRYSTHDNRDLYKESNDEVLAEGEQADLQSRKSAGISSGKEAPRTITRDYVKLGGYWDRSGPQPKWVNGPNPVTVPQSPDDLLGYEDNCYEAAAGLVDDYPGLKGISGLHDGSPHAWAVGHDGTIYDPARWTVANDDAVAIIPRDDPRWHAYQSSNDKTSMKLGAVPEGYEIRPMGDTGYFEHEEGKWRPRYYEVKDRNTGEMVRGDRMQTSHGRGDGVVAYYGDDPVGSLTWQEEPHATMIGSAYVHPDHRQQGLFNAMYEYLPQGKPVDAYHWDNPMLRQKVRDRQRQTSMKLGGMEHYAEQVPIDWLAPYIEFAREPGAEHFDRPGGSWESLRDDIAQNGIREPLIFEYDPDAGTGYVSEGSTRYSVAKELGLPSLPVLVLRSRERPGRPFVPVTQPGQYLIKDALPGGDFPQYSPPSEIGIPTVGGTTARTAMAQRLDPKYAEYLTEHIHELAKLYGVEVHYTDLQNPSPIAAMGDIWINPIRDTYDYFVALHEVGHIAAHQADRGDIQGLHGMGVPREELNWMHGYGIQPELSTDEMDLEDEAAVWRWAAAQSKIKVGYDLWQDATKDLHSYLEGAKEKPWYTEEEVPGYPRTGPMWDWFHQQGENTTSAKLAMDWMGDAYPGEDHTEEKTIDKDWTQLQFTEDPKTKVEEHNWIMSGGYVKISDEDFESLMALMGHKDDWKPLAYGTVEAYYNYEMMFHLQKSNIATHLVEKGLKKYCTDHQLKYEGILSADGTFWEDQAKEASWERTADVPGVGRENPDKLWRMHMIDTQPVDYYGEQDSKIDNEPQGEMICPHCGEICDSYGDFLVHEERAHHDGLGIPDSPQPVVEFDDPMPAHFNTNPDTRTDMTVNRQAAYSEHFQPGDLVRIKGSDYPTDQDIEVVEHRGTQVLVLMGSHREPGSHQSPLWVDENLLEPMTEPPASFSADLWPDTLPWGEEGNEYYRQASWDEITQIGKARGYHNPDESVEFMPEKPYVDPVNGPFWKMTYDPREDVHHFWFTDKTGSPHHDDMMPINYGNFGDPWLINAAGYGHNWEPDEYFNESVQGMAEAYADGERAEDSFGDYEDVPYEEHVAEKRQELADRIRRLVGYHRRDIEDASKWGTQSSLNWRTYISAKMPLIPAPIPFIFDIESDKIHSGQPGHKHKDIKPKDKLTVNVVEGLYLPDGKLQFRTDSTMPYTVRYVIRMWYTLYPELEVKQVFKLVGDKKFKLANAKNIGAKVRDVAFTDQAAREAYSVLSNYGDLYIVGGAVRDICLGHLPNDMDLVAAGLTPDQISTLLSSLPGQTKIIGEDFPVFEYQAQDGSKVEIALPRTEVSTGEGHKEFDVQADPFLPIETDLARRDFTCNAQAVNMRTGEHIDPFNGQHDLSQHELKEVSPLKHDPLRILRAFALISGQGLKPDEEVKKAIEENAYKLRAVPPQKIYMQLDKIFGGRDPESAVRAMRDLGVLHYVMPEVAATIDFDQKNKHHKKTLDEHSLEVLRKVAEESDDPDLLLSSLYHDVGKVHSQWIDEDGNGHYYKKIHKDELTGKPTGEESGAHHEEVGAQMAHDFMTRNRYPDERRDRVVHLIRNHMFHAFEDMKGARKFVDKVSPEHAHDLLTLRNADQEGKGTADEWGSKVPVSLQRQMVQNMLDNEYGENPGMSQGRRPDQVGLANLAVNGKDLIAEGIPATSEMGRILHKLWEAVMDDPSLNNKAFLLEMARNFHQMKDASVHKTAAVPPEPGTIPAPPGSVRLYHYTGAPEGTLEREGIDISKAKGETYGEPNYVWASTQKPDPYTKRFAEFFMPHDDPRWDIGKYTPGMKYQNANGEWEESPEAWAHHLTSHRSNVTFYGSIRPEEIAAVHEPWHSNYRYMKEGNMSPEELSWIADQREQFPNEYRAYQELLKDHGRTSSILDPIRDSLDEAVFEHADADMPRLKPKIRHWIKRTIYKVLRDNNYPDPEEWTHLVLTGSLTTYQWSPSSDLDVALFLTHPIPDWRRAELISLLLKHIEDVPVPGTTHRLGIYIEPVERKPSDIFRPGLRSAFDIDNDRWIVLPERERTIDIQKEMGNLLTYAKTVAAKMKTLILYDPPGAKTYWHQIMERWRRDQTAGKGDYHESNIVYKYLMKHHLSPFLTRNRKPASIDTIGSRLTVGHRPLESAIGVQIPAPEWNDDPIEWEAA